MKKVLALLILNTLVFGQEIVEFKTGVTSEYCFGYCLSELTITANDADYTLYGWDGMRMERRRKNFLQIINILWISTEKPCQTIRLFCFIFNHSYSLYMQKRYTLYITPPYPALIDIAGVLLYIRCIILNRVIQFKNLNVIFLTQPESRGVRVGK